MRLENNPVPQAIRWLPSIVVMAGIFAASATPASMIPTFGLWDVLVKKSGHFLGYALLGISFLLALKSWKPKPGQLAVMLSFLYAVSDELHQLYTPGRHSSPVDVLIDTLGAAAGVIVISLVTNRPQRSTNPP